MGVLDDLFKPLAYWEGKIVRLGCCVRTSNFGGSFITGGYRWTEHFTTQMIDLPLTPNVGIRNEKFSCFNCGENLKLVVPSRKTQKHIKTGMLVVTIIPILTFFHLLFTGNERSMWDVFAVYIAVGILLIYIFLSARYTFGIRASGHGKHILFWGLP